MATFHAVILKGPIHVRQDKTTNIKIRITHNRKVENVSTDLYVNPDNFEKGQATGKNSSFINGRIRDELSRLNGKYLRMGPIVKKLSAKELRQRLYSDDESDCIDFLEFADKYYQELIKKGKLGSARGLKGVISNLKKYQPEIYFHDIDLQFLNGFVEFLKGNGVKNGVDNYMREFRLLFKVGIDRFNDEDRAIIRIPQYPFKKFKFERIKRKTSEKRLTVEQMKMLRDFRPDRGREQMAKDMFLLMFYLIGINTADLYTLQKPDKKGRLNYVRAKTGRDYSIKLEPEALEIIARYEGSATLINAAERYGNYLDWQKYINMELKRIGESIEKEHQKADPEFSYPKTISTNWARHTWATIARNNCRINKDDVALCLGHEDPDNTVTDIYIDYDYSIIDESNRKVLDTLKETEPKEGEPQKQE